MALINIESLLMKTKNRRPLVIAAPLVFGALAGGMLIVNPAMQSLSVTKAQIGSLKEKEASYNFLIQAEKSLESHRARFTGKDKTWLIEHLNRIAEETGVQITTIAPDDPSGIGEFLERIPVKVEGFASFHQLGEFASRVEGLDAYVKILAMELASPIDGQAMPSGGPRPRGHELEMSVALVLWKPETAPEGAFAS